MNYEKQPVVKTYFEGLKMAKNNLKNGQNWQKLAKIENFSWISQILSYSVLYKPITNFFVEINEL